MLRSSGQTQKFDKRKGLRVEVMFYMDWTNTSKWNGYMERKKGWHLKMDFGERRDLILVHLVGVEKIARRCGSKRFKKG